MNAGFEHSPCERCAQRRICEEREHRCQEWTSWWYRSFRRYWRRLRRGLGYTDDKRVWQYRAPYEPAGKATAADKPVQAGAARPVDPWMQARIRELKELWEQETPEATARAADILWRLKRERRLSQTVLAQAAGVALATVNRTFTGRTIPKPETWKKILRGLETLGAEEPEKGEKK